MKKAITKLNDIKTEKLANEILNGPIPDSTEVIEIISGCGNVTKYIQASWLFV